MYASAQDPTKRYQRIARSITTAIAEGVYLPGDKLPSERQLAEDFGVSRPTVRDAMIALEFQGVVEARDRSGFYVNMTAPIAGDTAEIEISAIELAEARRLFEGEACALAAAIITDQQVALLDHLTAGMEGERPADEIERLEQEFHLTIALATGNAAIAAGVEDLWILRQQSPLCAATLRRARSAGGGDVVGEHRKIAVALRDHDPRAARQAVHDHLAQVIDDLLALAEAEALQQTRQKMAEQRRILARRTEI